MKLALGTVQFGLDYGVSNNDGTVAAAQITEILTLAHQVGIITLDTAFAYGNSEQALGAQELSHDFNIVSKIPALAANLDTINNASIIDHFLNQSLERLKTNSLYGLLFHSADDLLSGRGEQLFQQALMLKSSGKVKKLGVSVYTPAQLEAVCDKLSIDLVQIPVNCIDQRFVTGDQLKRLKSKSIEVHSRSAFLQGLLLMSKRERPAYFKPVNDVLNRFDNLLEKHQCDAITLALAFLLHNKNAQYIDKIVVGCCSALQLSEIVLAYHNAKNLCISPQDFDALASNNEALINPSTWQV